MSIKTAEQGTGKAKPTELTEDDLEQATGGAGRIAPKQTLRDGNETGEPADSGGNPNFQQFEDFAP